MDGEYIIKISPDKEMVKSILSMVEIRELRIKETNREKFVSLLVEDYYEVVKELATSIMNLDGYKTLSHKELFIWIKKRYSEFTDEVINIINNLRTTRNNVVYEGFFVKEHYLAKKLEVIDGVIFKLKSIVKRKL